MPSRSLDELGALQREVLEVVWDAGEATVHAVRDRMAAAAGRAPAYTTVLTALQKLAAAGWLEHRRDGRRYVYRPTRTRRQAEGGALRRLVTEVFGGDRELALQQLIESERIEPAELRRLRDLIDEKLREA